MKKSLVLLFSIYSLMAGAYERNFMEGYTIEPSQTNDGKTASGLSLLDGKLAVSKNGKVYIATMDDSLDIQSLTEREDLSKLNMDGQFAQKGNSLYFSKDGVLYVATKKNGQWGNPVKVKMDGIGDERTMGQGSSFAYRRWTYRPEIVRIYNPALSKDGKRLYFSSDKSNGIGGLDIWYSDVKKDGQSWSEPKNMTNVNSQKDEDYPKLIGDSVIYFSSNREESQKGVNIFKQSMVMPNTMEAVAISTELVAADFNSNKDDSEFIVAEGIPFVISNRGGKSEIYRPEIIKPEPVIETPVDTTPVIAVVRKDFRTCILYFVFDETNMIESYDAEFNYLYDFINEDTESKIMVVGHTDERGTDDYNMTLSDGRAKAVYDRLIKMGVPQVRMKYKGEGESHPVIPNAKTEEEHQKNRRVEVIKIDLSNEDNK